jgi:PPK2 family polyphosphate:nucleotide phosphotransferase
LESGASSLKHRFIVHPGSAFSLADRDPADASAFATRELAEAQLDVDAKAIDHWQDRLYAEGRRALLVVLQGTDTSGKDSAIRGVFNETTPLGVTVTAFGEPSKLELAHDYLWRIHAAVPRRGTIGIFNRSHYEDVLVVKVKKLAPPEDVERRYEQINQFEKTLTENGTTVLKFMLHLSEDEQKKQLQERRDDPEKRWKFNPRDLDDRALWPDFQAAYEVMVQRCSTPWAPWYVIPADRKWARNAAVSGIVRETLEAMAPDYPNRDLDPSAYPIE